jgi:hypothetical protein
VSNFPEKRASPDFSRRLPESFSALPGSGKIQFGRQGKIPAGTFPVSTGNLQIPENCAACGGCCGRETFWAQAIVQRPDLELPAALLIAVQTEN